MKYREIGSEFHYNVEDIIDGYESKENNILKFLNINEDELIYINSGRSAINYILNKVVYEKYDKILIPAYICESILLAVKKSNIDYEFYAIDENFNIDIKDLDLKLENGNKCIFFINYFGYPQSEEVELYLNSIKNKNLLIEDCTHSFLSSNLYSSGLQGHYQVISMRKWYGIPDGGIIVDRSRSINWKDLEYIYDDFFINRLLGQLIKSEYIKNKKQDKDLHIQLISNGEEQNNQNYNIGKMSKLSNNILKNQDYYEILYKRKKNYCYLYDNIKNMDFIDIIHEYWDSDICPIGCVIKVQNRDAFRMYLAKNGIYCPVHWQLPEEVKSIYQGLNDLSNNILTIPCDQRYTLDDMKYIIYIMTKYGVDNIE